MDREAYAKFYGYGAYGGFTGRQESAEFHERRYALFGAFLEVNPLLVPSDHGAACCLTHILRGGRWGCHKSPNYCATDFTHDIYDHRHAMRFYGIRKSMFIATHPYNYTPDNTGYDYSNVPGNLLRGLVANVYPKDKSWYYPGVSNLCIIGRQDILDRIDLSVLGTPVEVYTGRLER